MSPVSNFTEIRPVVAELVHAERGTDTPADGLDKVIDSLRDHAKAINPYPTAFPYGNGMVLHFYQQQESSTTKTVHKVINKRLKAYV